MDSCNESGRGRAVAESKTVSLIHELNRQMDRINTVRNEIRERLSLVIDNRPQATGTSQMEDCTDMPSPECELQGMLQSILREAIKERIALEDMKNDITL